MPHTRSAREFWGTYTKDLTADDFQRLFTRDARDAYDYFARGFDPAALRGLSWHQRLFVQSRLLFTAFTSRLSPARRALFGVALLCALIGMAQLFSGFRVSYLPLIPFVFNLGIPGPAWSDGTFWLFGGFVLVNLLVLLEVADRLSLKHDLEIAREIQLAMLPNDTFTGRGIEIAGRTRPANTVGGDLYDIVRLGEDRLLVVLGDVSGKGSPAALLMALLLAMLRTLAPDDHPLPVLAARLNRLIYDQTPGARFITCFLAIVDLRDGQLSYVNAGQTPPLLRRQDGRIEKLSTGGIALGMFDQSTYEQSETHLEAGDLLVAYSDGITEAENRAGEPFDEDGLERAIHTYGSSPAPDLARTLFTVVEQHAGDMKMMDDLTIVVVKRTDAVPPPLPPTT
ncbi:MAG: PP2C family protein-serine/threonine phosphatase [Acidobacteria bacterium]|nr:PP2C family protein-serine/threonine phosphatase [Acidobacteriota bacterium]